MYLSSLLPGLGVCLVGASPLVAVGADPQTARVPWRGMHLPLGSQEDVPVLKRLVSEALAPMGVNVLVLEVNYSFRFNSHPEVSDGSLTAEGAREVAALCGQLGIRVIPLLNCLGHQSWAERTGGLLRAHPEFDETPHIPFNNPDIYCRSWCPLHPGVNAVVFDLMDELLDGFEADALHVGMDEVFLIASDQCPRCRGKNPAELFAKAVHDIHAHLVGQKGVEMLMWGDRLLNAEETGYGPWEAAANGTDPAIHMIPKDIIICDWHYEVLDRYPSVRIFQDNGFRVLVCPWQNPAAAQRFLDAATQDATDRLLGVLCTGWAVGGGGSRLARVLLDGETPEQDPELATAAGVAQVLRRSLRVLGATEP